MLNAFGSLLGKRDGFMDNVTERYLDPEHKERNHSQIIQLR